MSPEGFSLQLKKKYIFFTKTRINNKIPKNDIVGYSCDGVIKKKIILPIETTAAGDFL